MIETLYVNGCSWMEGYMLHEEQHVKAHAKAKGFEFDGMWNVRKNGDPVLTISFKEIYNDFNLPGVIASELDIPKIYNDAEGAGSNARIVRTTVDYIKKLTQAEKEKTLVIIGWSLLDRNEIFLEDKIGNSKWCNFNLTQRFSDFFCFSELDHQDLDPKFVKRIDDFWELYVVDIHSYYYSIKKFFEQSYLLANLLENHKIKYYFFNTFPIFWGYEKVHLDSNWILDFQKDIEIHNSNNSILPTDITFQEYIQFKENCHISDGHPNSKGYRAWAEYILEDMKRKGIV